MSDDHFNLIAHWAKHEAMEREERQSWAHPMMNEIYKMTLVLMYHEGWKDASYCPKDGSVFLGWSPTQSMPYRCVYSGEWPTGSWLALQDGDAWPCRPVLFKPLLEAKDDGSERCQSESN